MRPVNLSGNYKQNGHTQRYEHRQGVEKPIYHNNSSVQLTRDFAQRIYNIHEEKTELSRRIDRLYDLSSDLGAPKEKGFAVRFEVLTTFDDLFSKNIKFSGKSLAIYFDALRNDYFYRRKEIYDPEEVRRLKDAILDFANRAYVQSLDTTSDCTLAYNNYAQLLSYIDINTAVKYVKELVQKGCGITKQTVSKLYKQAVHDAFHDKDGSIGTQLFCLDYMLRTVPSKEAAKLLSEPKYESFFCNIMSQAYVAEAGLIVQLLASQGIKPSEKMVKVLIDLLPRKSSQVASDKSYVFRLFDLINSTNAFDRNSFNALYNASELMITTLDCWIEGMTKDLSEDYLNLEKIDIRDNMLFDQQLAQKNLEILNSIRK